MEEAGREQSPTRQTLENLTEQSRTLGKMWLILPKGREVGKWLGARN